MPVIQVGAAPPPSSYGFPGDQAEILNPDEARRAPDTAGCMRDRASRRRMVAIAGTAAMARWLLAAVVVAALDAVGAPLLPILRRVRCARRTEGRA